jgi:flagellar protein FlbD
MITLHRLGHHDEPFHLNDDLIVTVEACPDTVISLATGAKIVVTESPAQVAEAVREWRASIRLAALKVA